MFTITFTAEGDDSVSIYADLREDGKVLTREVYSDRDAFMHFEDYESFYQWFGGSADLPTLAEVKALIAEGCDYIGLD